MRSTFGFVATLAIIFAGAWLGFSQTGKMLTGRWTYTEKVEVDRGTYFRLKVDYTYRGEPQKFDIVVGCNVLNIRYADGSGSRTAGLVPNVYGQRMSDGNAVVVRPPNACGGDTTANGRVPEDFLPIMIVYDDAETVAFGTAYMTDDAYDNQRSVMTFSKATVETATRVEFDAFRDSGPPNVVTRSRFWSTQSPKSVEELGLTHIHPAFGWHCYAYERWKLSGEERGIVRKFWPGNKPGFWIPEDAKSEQELRYELYQVRGLTFGIHTRIRDDGRVVIGGSDIDPDYGAGRRDGARMFFSPHKRIAPSLYPTDTQMSEDKWPSTPDQRLAHLRGLDQINLLNIDLAGTETRGFAYCYQIQQPAPLADPAGEVASLRAKTTTAEVDARPIEGATPPWHLGGMPRELRRIFENDEYMLEYREYYLELHGGDV